MRFNESGGLLLGSWEGILLWKSDNDIEIIVIAYLLKHPDLIDTYFEFLDNSLFNLSLRFSGTGRALITEEEIRGVILNARIHQNGFHCVD